MYNWLQEVCQLSGQLLTTSGVGAHDKWGGPVASLMKNGGVSRPIGHRTNIVSVKKWGGQSPPKPPCSDAYVDDTLDFGVGTISETALFAFKNGSRKLY